LNGVRFNGKRYRSCSFGRATAWRAQGSLIRRIVRDFITAAIDREKPHLEQFIAEHLRYPDAFPLEPRGPVGGRRE
jgi:hypothetical protein